jgi:EmrB/QacA subfamily drug resistance transporter
MRRTSIVAPRDHVSVSEYAKTISPGTAGRLQEEARSVETNLQLDATRKAFRSVFPGVVGAMFLAAVDQTIVATALPAISASLAGFADLSWVAVAYLLAATVTAPLYGHLGDRFGRRRMLLAALAVFTLGSFACAVAQTIAALIAGRALQGLGGGGLMSLSQALISEHVPPRERARFQGYFGAVFALSSTLGPVLGGYLTQYLSWRAVFGINLPLAAGAALLALRIPQSRQPGSGRFHPDVPGVILFSASATALLFALGSAGHRFDWTSPTLVALIGGAALGAAALVWWERRAVDPVIPVRLLAIPAILRTNSMVFCFAGALFAAVLYLPLYLQVGRGFGIGESGLLLLPITLTIALASVLTGKLISWSGRLTVFPAAGLALSTLAFAILAATVATAPTPLVVALIMAAAAGLGTVMPASQIIVQDSAGNDALGSATASVSVSRSLGAAFGVALVGALVYLLVGRHDAVAAHMLQRLAQDGAAYDGGQGMAKSAVAADLDRAFRLVFAALATLTAIGCALALSVPRRRI